MLMVLRYQMSQCATDKPRFRGPETDVLHDLEKDKLKNIRVQMIRADVQQNDSFRKAYVIEESAASRSKGRCYLFQKQYFHLLHVANELHLEFVFPTKKIPSNSIEFNWKKSLIH